MPEATVRVTSFPFPTPTARVVAWAGRNPPLPWPLGPIAGWLGALFTAGLLPERFRKELGYTWPVRKEVVFRTILALSRAAARIVPRTLRHLPNRYLIRRKTPLGLWRHRPLEIPDDISTPSGGARLDGRST